MAEPDKLDESYRRLAREEPSASIDTAILAASRRALGRPSLTRRWAMPVSIAAVLVLAVGVTLRMQQEQPGIELQEPAARIAPPQAAAPAPERKPAEAAPEVARVEVEQAPAPEKKLLKRAAPKPFADSRNVIPAPAPAAPPAAAPAAPPAPEPQAIAPPRAEPALPAAPPARAAAAPSAQGSAALQSVAPRAKREAAADSSREVKAAVILSDEERELERIARLRAEGKHEEADKALEEFRRKHPAFRIPEAMWERVKPR